MASFVLVRLTAAFAYLALLFATLPAPAIAGTTGTVTGRVTDAQSHAPIAGVNVTISSPSQSATTQSDASGAFRFLSLIPDTYTVSLTKSGYEPVSQPGIVVFADQGQTVSIELTQALRTIARVTSTTGGNLVKSGTTSDVYSVNAATATAAAGLTGPGSLSNAYGAISSVPGVAIDPGEQGWFQMVHIRGGDIDQVGYELDGIPVNRVYDNAPQTMLSSLGQQELQVYTGGTPASADAQGISGYINQVVKTGTYPGYANATLSAGFPAFYHGASVEAGGSTPDRNFSYYVGIGGADQDYRYVNNSDGAGDSNWFFYPVNAVDPSSFSPGPCTATQQCSVYVGSNVGAPLFGPGYLYSIANTEQRDTIVNVHLGIPRANGLRDDVQALYLTSEVWATYFSSQNDIGPSIDNFLGQSSWDDTYVYNGPVGLNQAPVAGDVVPYYFPSSPTDRAMDAALPADLRDANDNGVALWKLQYTHAFSQNAYIRAYGYMLYSNWFINGPNTAAQPYYGAELADYEIPDHTFGGNVNFTDQLGEKHLLNVTYGYTGANLQRYDIGYLEPDYSVASYTDGTNCYDPNVGGQVGCIWQAQNYGTQSGDIQSVMNGTLPAGTTAGANWEMTNDTFYTGSGQALNQVGTRFSGMSIGDTWRPNDNWTVNLGVRNEEFQYDYGQTGSNDPVRQWWFEQYNNEYCYMGPGMTPASRANAATGALGACPASVLAGSNPYIGLPLNQTPYELTNPGNLAPYEVSRFEPRFSFTDALNPSTVIRGSAGVYARPPNSSWVEYNVVQEDLPLYLGNHFAAYGFTTPEHNIRPDTSFNYDLSLEHHIKGTDISYKLSPFYRATRDQLQNFFIDPAGGLESGLNVGNQVSEGVELAITKGDFARDGWAGQLSYTFTHSQIRYKDFQGQSVNVIDQLNDYIEQYNGFTKGGGGSPCYYNLTSGMSGPVACSNANAIANPYYNNPVQGLLNDSAWYPTYDVIPGPFAGLNGYAVPHTASLLVQYKEKRLTTNVGLQFSSGAEYGAPTSWPGYDPSSCSATLGAATSSGAPADPAYCANQIFIPDPYNNNNFDQLGQFKQPWFLTGGLSIGYDLTPRIHATLSFVNLFDICGQRGYAWDNAQTCVYGALGGSLLAPAGNFYPNSYAAAAPVQMAYPYGVFMNNTNTGFLGTTEPLQITGSIQFKL